MKVKHQRAAVYRMYGAAGNLLYVGFSVHPVGRIAQHRSSKPWGHLIAHTAIEWFDSLGCAADAERIAIAEERPEFNISGTRSQQYARPAIIAMSAHDYSGPQRMVVGMDSAAIYLSAQQVADRLGITINAFRSHRSIPPADAVAGLGTRRPTYGWLPSTVDTWWALTMSRPGSSARTSRVRHR